jgi:polysaccharide biosynthesis protein PslJ
MLTSNPLTVRTYSRRIDTSTFLSLYLLVLCVLPSRFVLVGLGGAGNIAGILALLGFVIWAWARLHAHLPSADGPNSIRNLAAAWLICVLISFWVAMSRPISDVEHSTANLGILQVLGWIGVMFLTTDTVSSLERLQVLLRRLVAAGALVASVALAQFFTGDTLIDHISIPGMVLNQPLGGVSSREGFNRPVGTATHAIELSMVITMLLPIALSLAVRQDGRHAIRRWFPVMALGLAIPIAISRSAIVGGLVGTLLVLATWRGAQRRQALLCCFLLITGLFLFVPGLLGSLVGLFSGIPGDDSVASRTDSFPIALAYIEHWPIFGRGYSTFLPDHWILDNQYLGLLIEIGIVGLTCFLSLLVAAVLNMLRVRRRSSNSETKATAWALLTAIAVGAIELALFDGLGFPMGAGILFFILGLSGAFARLATGSNNAGLQIAES